jgi:hypothetical protein
LSGQSWIKLFWSLIRFDHLFSCLYLENRKAKSEKTSSITWKCDIARKSKIWGWDQFSARVVYPWLERDRVRN